MSSDPDSLVFTKSLALIQKTKKRVAQVDGAEFPTPSSNQARDLLLNTLDALANKTLWPAMNPEALYSILIHIQSLVEQVEASNSAHISWPLVSCCDQIWKQLYPNGEAKIFYTVKGLTKGLPDMASYISTISVDHGGDRVEVSAFSDPDNDRLAIESAIGKYLDQLKTALEKFIAHCWQEFLTDDIKDKQFPAVSTEDVFQLLHRLENNILPNIIPNNTLLGVPASFSAILNASAIYRIYVLSTSDWSLGPDTIYRDIQKVERLTAKALEVSYIQKEFKKWETTNKP